MEVRAIKILDKEFIFISNYKCFKEFLNIFNKNKDKIIKDIESEFKEILAKRIYIILDNFSKSSAVLDRDIGLIKLKIGEREPKEVLRIFIHELCHLTKEGNFPFGKTPESIHKKFDLVSKKILNEIENG